MVEGFCKKCEDEDITHIAEVEVESWSGGSRNLIVKQCKKCKKVFVEMIIDERKDE